MTKSPFFSLAINDAKLPSLSDDFKTNFLTISSPIYTTIPNATFKKPP